MSYSRWSDSNWYSFYNASRDDSKKEEQALSLWHVSESKTFTYKELLSFGEGKLMSLYPEATDDDIQEALGFIERFISEVNTDFAEDDLK
jgi:hypothetical protein